MFASNKNIIDVVSENDFDSIENTIKENKQTVTIRFRSEDRVEKCNEYNIHITTTSYISFVKGIQKYIKYITVKNIKLKGD